MSETPPRIARYLDTGYYRVVAILRYDVPAFCESPGGLLVAQLVNTGGEPVDGHEEVWFTLTTPEEIAWAESQLRERPELAGVADRMPEGLGVCAEDEDEPP